MAGEEDGHRLVAHLHVAHPSGGAFGFFVLRGQEHRQQVAVIALAPPPFRDHPVDDRVELRARRPSAPQLRHRQVLQQVRERQHRHPERFHDAGERLADLGRLRLDVGVEQRLADDRQRQPIHFLRDVERRAIAPRAAHAIGIGDHRVGIRRDPLAMERRLHQPPLSQMRRAFAGQEPFAEQALGALQRRALW